MSSLNFKCWNCSGIYGNYAYAKNLLDTSDVLALSEHWLYEDELNFLGNLDDRFDYFASSSHLNNNLYRWKRGQGGVAIFWRKKLKIKKLSATDSMIAIKIKTGCLRWTMVCGIYFPSTNHSICEFKEALSALELLCLRERGDDNLVILGDFNAHIAGARSVSQENTRGRLVRETLQKLDLNVTNLLPSCVGPRHTYKSSIAYSTIDYICVDSNLLQQLRYSKVTNMHSHNLTHHLPVEVSIGFLEKSVSCDVTQNMTRPKIAWRKCTDKQLGNYQMCLNERLQSLPELDDNPESIEKYACAISESIAIASNVLPHVKYKRHIKPYWNKNLTFLKNMVSEKYRLWTNEGRPRGRSYQTFVDYKDAKRMFRKEQRNCVTAHDAKEYEDMAREAEQNYDSFWRMVNSRKRGKKEPLILEVNGEILDDPQCIAEKWANYFEDLHKPKQHEQSDDVKRKVESIVTRQNDDEDILDSKISTAELKQVVTSLPNGKASGLDGICYEHVKMGGEILLKHLELLFNAIVILEYIPASFKLAIKVPIPKGGNKQSRTFDDSRGISLLPVLDKILQRIILNRISKRPKSVIHCLQGAYQKQQDALTTAFMIDETIKNCCEEGDQVYACFVDISKAFDRMWIDAMLYKLYHHAKIQGKCWRLIRNWYMDMKEVVYINGFYSRDYTLLQGTRQGGILSPWLFLVYINDLITELEQSGWGVFLYRKFYGSPMFADDLTALSRIKYGLENLLKCLDEYATKWRIVLNIKKTVILVFGEKIKNILPNRDWLLGDVPLKEKKIWKNLGKIWHVDPTSAEPVESALRKGFEIITALARIGCRPGALNPKVSAKLWKSIALPYMLYGCELWYLNGQQSRDLEKVLNMFCRVAQSLLPGSSGSAARGLLGLHSITTEINKRKLYFLSRIINSDTCLAHRKLFVRRLIRWKWKSTKMSGFIPDIMKVLEDFDLLGYVTDFIKNDCFPSKARWKSIVISAITKKGQLDWVEKIRQKSVSQLYLAAHPSLELSKWYDLWNYSPSKSKMITDVIRLICGSLTISNNRLGNDGTLSGVCSACDGHFTNPVHHALLYCDRTEEARENWWAWITDNLPITVCYTVNLLDEDRFIQTLLGDISVFSSDDINVLNSDYWAQCAHYISYCVQNSIFDPFRKD